MQDGGAKHSSHDYASLPLMESEESDASTVTYGQRRTPRPRNLLRVLLRTLFRIVLGTWAVMTLAAAVMTLPRHFSDRPLMHCTASGERYRVAEDFTSNVPQFATRLFQFEEAPEFTFDPRYATKGEVDNVIRHWASISPQGQGFILANLSQDLLPAPKWNTGAGESLHNLAVYHQLHCLYRLMMAYNDAVLGKPTDVGQARHCFGYLRQSIACFGDTTPEGVNPESGKPETAKTGAQRVCKDYGQLLEWTEAHRRRPKADP